MQSASCQQILAIAVVIVGWVSSFPSIAQDQPPTNPTLPSTVSARPLYSLDNRVRAAGTAFVIQDKAHKYYMLTAAHVMSDADWKKISSVALRTFDGNVIAKAEGKPVYLGKKFQTENTGVDLVIWPFGDSAKVSPLQLAKEDPKTGDWVWVIGEPVNTKGQKMFRCKVKDGSRDDGLILKQHDTFELRAFSGAPIVNAKGQVVGTLLGSGSEGIITSKVSTIRARLSEVNIVLP